MSYIEEHNACGLKVGDRVRVTRKSENKEGGWGDNWLYEMDCFVGHEHTIVGSSERGGFFIKNKGGECWNFPYFVLKKVTDSPEKDAPEKEQCIEYHEDQEVLILKQIWELITSLDSDAQTRVLDYVRNRLDI